MSEPESRASPFDFASLIRSGGDVREYAPGETLFREGEPGDSMFVLLDGTVEVDIGGQVVCILEPGNLVGEMSIINDEARSATVRAKTAARAVPIDKKRFLFLTQQTPFFALHVMRLLSDRLRRASALT